MKDPFWRPERQLGTDPSVLRLKAPRAGTLRMGMDRCRVLPGKGKPHAG